MKKLAVIHLDHLLSRTMAGTLLALVLFAARADPGQTEMVAIGFPATSEATLSLTSLRAIFGMIQRDWPDKTPIRVFVLRDEAPEHGSFSKTVLQVFPHQLRQAWERGALSGRAAYPVELDSAQEMLARVASTPGAIGYLRASEVNGRVRVIAIEQRPAYAIPAASDGANPPGSLPPRPALAGTDADRNSNGTPGKRAQPDVPAARGQRRSGPFPHHQPPDTLPASDSREAPYLRRLIEFVRCLAGSLVVAPPPGAVRPTATLSIARLFSGRGRECR